MVEAARMTVPPSIVPILQECGGDALRVITTVLFLVAACSCGKSVIRDVAESHVEANVPAAEDFDPLLRRDLELYFWTKNDKPVSVEYELLRDGPTQSGIAYPKFYVWVLVRDGDITIEQGAVRLACIDRTEFRVTAFISEPEIRAHPAGIYDVFPVPVCERIKVALDID